MFATLKTTKTHNVLLKTYPLIVAMQFLSLGLIGLIIFIIGFLITIVQKNMITHSYSRCIKVFEYHNMLIFVVPLTLANTHLLNVQVFSGFVNKFSNCNKN